ncbi:MAG: alpha/beta hydrolase [Solirubrobacteraceae bacterium]
MAAEREELRFLSGGDECAGWLYRPNAVGKAPCVVMAHGFSLTRHDGLSAYAKRLAAAGAMVLVFDHRFLGDSGGLPRQRFRKAEQIGDWRSAVAFARTLDGVDPTRIVVWGFSFSGGHVVETAASDPQIAAVLALCPLLDGLARVLATPPPLSAWLIPRALADQLGRHNLVPVTAQPGEHAAMALPGEADGIHAIVPSSSPWRNEISPGIFLTAPRHRPLRHAKELSMPVWLGLGERDVSVSAKAIERFAARIASSELRRYPYEHFGPFIDEGPQLIAADQIDFLRRNGLLLPG